MREPGGPLTSAEKDIPQHVREVFWLVPMAIAGSCRTAGQFQAALDWYRTVFAFHLPPDNRRIYHGPRIRGGLSSHFGRLPEWLARPRAQPAPVRPRPPRLLHPAHRHVDRRLPPRLRRRRVRPQHRRRERAGPDPLRDGGRPARPRPRRSRAGRGPVPANPVWESLREAGRDRPDKIHRGLNIAGPARPTPNDRDVLPSQYRYAVLVERAKNLVATAQQLEAAYLSALDQRDARPTTSCRRTRDLRVAGARWPSQTSRSPTPRSARARRDSSATGPPSSRPTTTPS